MIQPVRCVRKTFQTRSDDASGPVFLGSRLKLTVTPAEMKASIKIAC